MKRRILMNEACATAALSNVQQRAIRAIGRLIEQDDGYWLYTLTEIGQRFHDQLAGAMAA